MMERFITAPVIFGGTPDADGLLLDAFRMAEASIATLALDLAQIPVADAARAAQCLRWGDDYELLFTAPPSATLPVAAHRIGTVIPRADAPLTLGGEPLRDPASLGFRHG